MLKKKKKRGRRERLCCDTRRFGSSLPEMASIYPQTALPSGEFWEGGCAGIQIQAFPPTSFLSSSCLVKMAFERQPPVEWDCSRWPKSWRLGWIGCVRVPFLAMRSCGCWCRCVCGQAADCVLRMELARLSTTGRGGHRRGEGARYGPKVKGQCM